MKELWIFVGIMSMGLGIIGIVLPILPTTPFFLLTAFSFSKGSTRFSKWFHSISFVQKHLTSLTMTTRKKWMLNISVDTVLVLYILLFDSLIIRILLGGLILAKHYFFYRFVSTN